MEKGQRGEIIKGGSNHSCVTARLYLVPQAVMMPHTGVHGVTAPSSVCLCEIRKADKAHVHVCVSTHVSQCEHLCDLSLTALHLHVCFLKLSSADRMRW